MGADYAAPLQPVFPDAREDQPVTLWVMRKGVHRLRADVLRLDGRWEVRLSAENVVFTWRRFAQRPSAVAFAQQVQQDLELDHWYQYDGM